MPAVSRNDIVAAIIDAVEQSGEAAVRLAGKTAHPRRFVITGSDGITDLWVYAWTLTFGGRPSLPDEYRIQMTTVKSPLEMNPRGPTVLIGYDPDLQVFAGFDLQRHATFTTGSPSVQIDRRTFHAALQDGLAFDRKSNNEIAVSFRPDQFLAYVRNAEQLHKLGAETKTFAVLQKVSAMKPVSKRDLTDLAVPRQRIVTTVSRLAREANFKDQVLRAYGHRCAVTKMQLRLVEAAHILPVADEGSTDTVVNGLALSPTYHRAYDKGIIFLDEKYEMRVNPTKIDALNELKLGGGIEQVRGMMGKILLPPDRTQWPRPEFIRRANKVRAIIG